MASKQTQKRKHKKSYGKKKKYNTLSQKRKQKRKQSQKQKRKQSRKKKVGGSINPLRSLFRHVSFASTRLADTWSGRQTPIHYDPNVTSQFGKNVLTNGKIANIVGSDL